MTRLLCILLLTCSYQACAQKSNGKAPDTEKVVKKLKADKSLSVATFAGGCFWCTETIFENIKGVKEVISGYSGGKEKNPDYQSVGNGLTTHAEAFQVYYDPKEITF